ncbi:MAG: type VI secretion system-associated FHA domain protein TagH, partial [Acetobacteraceae bacterium]|nr:type VI secretion system-associated FHA domain protein TagH [Acetobacteraceae bacterium]
MLTLSILRCPDSMHPETRTLNGGEFRIGRGPENDWVLPDPAKTVSKHHCTVSYQGGGWELTDQSTNGSYLNRDARPVGRDRSRLLSDGDRLRFGPYEIEIHIAPDAATAPAPGDPFAASLPGASSFTQPRVLGPPPQLTPQSVALQADYDPVPPEPANPFDELPPQPDHTPSVDEAYRPPPVLAKVLPEDWDDFGLSPPKPSATPVAPPVTRVAEPVVPITPGVAISAPEPRENAAPQPLPPQGDLLAGFFRGAGLSDAHPADPAATMEALGAAFRALVS